MSAVCINLTRKEKENMQHSFLKSDLELMDFFSSFHLGENLNVFLSGGKNRREKEK